MFPCHVAITTHFLKTRSNFSVAMANPELIVLNTLKDCSRIQGEVDHKLLLMKNKSREKNVEHSHAL